MSVDKSVELQTRLLQNLLIAILVDMGVGREDIRKIVGVNTYRVHEIMTTINKSRKRRAK